MSVTNKGIVAWRMLHCPYCGKRGTLHVNVNVLMFKWEDEPLISMVLPSRLASLMTQADVDEAVSEIARCPPCNRKKVKDAFQTGHKG